MPLGPVGIESVLKQETLIIKCANEGGFEALDHRYRGRTGCQALRANESGRHRLHPGSGMNGLDETRCGTRRAPSCRRAFRGNLILASTALNMD